MRTVLIAGFLSLVCTVSAQAQTGVPSNWDLKIYQQGTGTVLSNINVQAPTVVCNQTPPTTTSTENPDRWVWNDPQNAGKVCIFLDATRLQNLPDGSYDGAATARNADGTSAESARAPFTRRRPNPPAAPSGVRLTP
jgi:hypothetical protein